MTAPLSRPRADEGVVTLTLPFPPSANKLWKPGKRVFGTLTMFRTPTYRKWIKLVDSELMAMRPRPWVLGHFTSVITLDKRRRRGNSDADNRQKPILDVLQRAGIIKNDALCDWPTIGLGEAPAGRCVVVLTPVGERAAA